MDLLIQTILSWEFSCHIFNPLEPFNRQQKSVIQFLLTTPLPPPLFAGTAIRFVQENLRIYSSTKQLDKAQADSKYIVKYKSIPLCSKKIIQEQEEQNTTPLHTPTQTYALDILHTTDVPTNATGPHPNEDCYIPCPPEEDSSIPCTPDPSFQHSIPVTESLDQTCPHQCHPPCNTQCLVCQFFSFHHPSPHCEWTNTRTTRSCTPRSYLYRPVHIDFCHEDLQKMKMEIAPTPYDVSSCSSLSYSQSSTSSVSSTSSKLEPKKPSKKPTYNSYLLSKGLDHAEALLLYSQWKKKQPKEPTGSSRPLHLPEKIYFEFAKQYYLSTDPL